MMEKEKKFFLLFWTASDAQPASLDWKLKIIATGLSRLPYATACVSTLFLPLYQEARVLQGKLAYALANSKADSTSFGRAQFSTSSLCLFSTY